MKTPWGQTTVSQQGVILNERGGAWTAAVRRQLPAEVRLYPARGLGECAAELAQHPGSLLALELTERNAMHVVALVDRMSRRFPGAVLIVLAQRGLEGFEGLCREAGAIYFTNSPRALAGLKGIVRRHFERAFKPPALSLAEQTWNDLPWSDAANA
jgi:hypothetical protein